MKRVWLATTLLLLALAGTAELRAFAQQDPPPPRRERGEGPRMRPGAGGPGGVGGVMARRRAERQQLMQFRILDRLSRMTPEARQQLLSRLPAQRRRSVEANLRRFQQMPPARREALAQRLRQFEQMTPERQEHLRGLMRDLGNLPPGRRQVLQEEFRRVKRMSEEDRLDYTSSESFRQKFDEPERELLMDLVETAPDP